MKKNKEMLTFVSKCSNIDYLKKMFNYNNIENKVEKIGKESYLYVSLKDYKRAVQIGLDIIYEDNLFGVKLADINGQVFFCEYLPIMNLLLPKLKYYDEIDKNGYPSEIENYIEKISEFCGTNIILVPSDDSYFFTAYALMPYHMHDLYSQRCKGYNMLVQNSPFLDIFYPTIFNEYDNFLETHKIKNRRNLLSYFKHSILFDVIYNPLKHTIAPTNQEAIKNLGDYTVDATMTLTSFLEVENSYISLNGNFKVSTEKGKTFEYRWEDAGYFSTEIWLSDDLVTIKSEVNASRSIFGYDYEKQNLRDGFFRELSNDGDNDFVKYTEYFQLIANGTRLLHFSNKFDAFEVFDIPDGWFIERGIDTGDFMLSKIFDESNFDKNDKDIAEIIEAIKKVKGGIKILKLDKNL